MAISIDPTETMTTLWTAENASGWTDITVDTFSGVNREGTYCLGIVVSNTTQQGYYTVSSFNSLTNKIYIWMVGRGQMDTLALGGVRVVVGDGANRVAYYVGGNDYVPAFNVNGWTCYVLDANNLPSGKAVLAGSESSMSWTAITQVGVGFKTTAKSLGGTENCFVDIARRGTGLNIKGGTFGDPGIWEEIAADDASSTANKAYGIVMEYQPGVYGLQGDITFGDGSGVTTTYFKDTNATVVFMDTGASAYSLSVVGNSTGTNTFIDGIAVGSGDTGTGRSGSSYLSANPIVTADFSDSNVDVLTLYGSKFTLISGGISFGSDTSHKVKGVSFQQNGQVDLGAVEARNCVFSETISSVGSLLWSSSIDIKNSNFIANITGAAVQHISAIGSPFVYDKLNFSGNTYDINNSSGSTISINKNNGSNPSTYTGSLVNFLGASVTTQITVKDLNTSSVIEGATVLVWVTDDSNYFHRASVDITGSGTTATVSHIDHGMATNDSVIIQGANEDVYNGAYQITVTGASSYQYTTNETITVTPATGTILSTFAIINEATNSSGIANDTRIINIDQSVLGWARKSSSSPYYQQGVISGTVDNDNGLVLTIQLVGDE